ncbi:MAG: OsmC family protein [Desulfosarcinaceae bacterium]|nr:OsmC family protein [Desulfosarcinaceae bacterium]
MPTTTVKWVSGKTFVGTDSRRHSVVLSGDDPSVGVSPSEMLLVAVSACSAYDVVAILEKKRKPLRSLEVTATGERDPEPPFPYRTIHIRYRLSGEGLTEAAVAQAIDLSLNKYCSVAATVRGVADLTTSFEMV